MPPKKLHPAPDETVRGGGNEPTIYIRELSGYGHLRNLAQTTNFRSEPLSHEQGGNHTISAELAARLTGRDLQLVQEWASTGESFIALVWVFPGSDYPEFRTRHLIVTGTGSGNVSFSGGIAWAQTIWKNYQKFQAANYHRPMHQGMTSRAGRIELDPSCAPQTGSDLKCPNSLVTAPLQQQAAASSTNKDDNWNDKMATRQLQTEKLAKMYEDAQAKFELNGDTSGFLAVLREARHFPEVWDPLGIPRFQF
ncbi:hypothetical protein VTK26DRAFT_6312 [Humicola hyalothermophila]